MTTNLSAGFILQKKVHDNTHHTNLCKSFYKLIRTDDKSIVYFYIMCSVIRALLP